MAKQTGPWADYTTAWSELTHVLKDMGKRNFDLEKAQTAAREAAIKAAAAINAAVEDAKPAARKSGGGTKRDDSRAGIIRRLKAAAKQVGLPTDGHDQPFSTSKLPAVKAAASFYAKLHTALLRYEEQEKHTRKDLYVFLKQNIGKAYLTAKQYETVTDASDSEAREVHIPPKDGVKNGNGVNDASRPKAVNPAKSGQTASAERAMTTAQAVTKGIEDAVRQNGDDLIAYIAAKQPKTADKPAKVGNTMTVLAGASKAGSRRARRAARNAKRAG